MLTPFIRATELGHLVDSQNPPILADCRWYLDGRSGLAAYRSGHLPGAIFIDLDQDLAAPVTPDSGRHPLPSPEAFTATLSRLGVGLTDTVVGYDDAGGVIAARLVWMLRAIGVDAAVLDGGLAAGLSAGLADGGLSTTDESRPATLIQPRPWPEQLLAGIDDAASLANIVLDARPSERFAGTGPDVDPRSGHIPGAVSVPCRENLHADDRLLSPGELRERFEAAGVTSVRVAAGEVVSSCGSGVTACHNLLAMEAAGLGRGRLYPGSWSQYAATDRPLETGLASRGPG